VVVQSSLVGLSCWIRVIVFVPVSLSPLLASGKLGGQYRKPVVSSVLSPNIADMWWLSIHSNKIVLFSAY
jgi:hypothetical protein